MFQFTLDFAKERDQQDSQIIKQNIASYAKPPGPYKGKGIYFLGHSCGLAKNDVQADYQEILQNWAKLDTVCKNEDCVRQSVAAIIGSQKDEIALTGSLTQCIHIVLSKFYLPQENRNKIFIDAPSFPSDIYAIKSLIQLHNLDVNENLIVLGPRENENVLREEDIIDILEKQGDNISVMFFEAVNYLTSQLYDIEKLTKIAKQKGINVGWDLAHAFGNVPLKLHDWEVDFAAYCTYKFTNSGPHNFGGLYIHSNRQKNCAQGIDGIRYPNQLYIQPPNPLLLSFMKSSFKSIEDIGINNLRSRSIDLTGYLEFCLKLIDPNNEHYKIITPNSRGSTLTLHFTTDAEKITSELRAKQIFVDFRKPNCMRIGPNAQYNTFEEIFLFAQAFKEFLQIN